MSHLIFTLDFHELVRGKLTKNTPCTINYDPLRLAAGIPGFVHGSPDFEFTAHLKFEPEGGQEVKLTSDTGIVTEAIVRNDGTGSMLTGDFVIPANAETIIVWISMKDSEGIYTYDSDFGENFYFRLENQDIEVKSATIENVKKTGLAKFTLTAESTPDIEGVTVRYRITNKPEFTTETPVELTQGKSKKGKATWTTGAIEVPWGSVIAYDLLYFVEGKKFKIENNGNYFLAYTA